MLLEITSREGLERVSRETKTPVDTIYFHFSIEGQLDESFPESPIRVFCFPAKGPRKYYLMVKDNVFIKPYCMLAQVPGTEFILHEFVDCLREFRVRALGALDSNRPHLIIAKEELAKVYLTLMKNVVCDVKHQDLRLHLFYMNEKQRNKILKKDYDLPEGYYFDDIDPQTEGELINSTWKHAKEGDLEQTMAKLMRLPSSCVKMDGLPVAFEMLDPAGFFNNQYVFEEHRRKGLGTAVETQLAQRCIQMGFVPFKTVDEKNTVALNASLTSPYWTQWTKENGSPVTMVFQEWTC